MKYLLILFVSIILCQCANKPSSAMLTGAGPSFTHTTPACVDRTVAVEFNNGHNNNCGHTEIQQLINEVWTTVLIALPINGISIFKFVPDTIGEYYFQALWTGNRVCVYDTVEVAWTEYQFTVIDCEDCETDFTAELECNPSEQCESVITFNFISEISTHIYINGIINGPSIELCSLEYDEPINSLEINNPISFNGDANVDACSQISFKVWFVMYDEDGQIKGEFEIKDDDGNIIARLENILCNPE